MRAGLTPLLVVLVVLVGCTSTPFGCRPAPSAAPATPTLPPPPPPTETPPPPTATPVPPPKVDPIAAIVARQAELQTFRQALSIEIVGIDPADRPVAMNVWAEGESARPNSSLHVGTDALGAPIGFLAVQTDGRLYLNPFGAWIAVDANAIPAGLPLIPVPIAADPAEMLPLLVGSQVVPVVGVPVRGTPTDVLRFQIPPERAEQILPRLLLQQTVLLLQGTPTYTELGGEIAVGRDDGFVRRVTLLVRGYSGGDQARTFSIQSLTELWDVNDPAIVVNPPSQPAFQLPRLGG